MVGPSKILTVSYGTFSCTLEGFDDPFNTMKAIAEYFRDLAAEDRYFGAEPPQPDAAMLHRIAEREIQRRVEAKIQDNGVILRAAENSPARIAAPMPMAELPPIAQTMAEPVPVQAPLAQAESAVAPELTAKLDRIRSAVAQSQAAETAPVAPAPVLAEPPMPAAAPAAAPAPSPLWPEADAAPLPEDLPPALPEAADLLPEDLPPTVAEAEAELPPAAIDMPAAPVAAAPVAAAPVAADSEDDDDMLEGLMAALSDDLPPAAAPNDPPAGVLPEMFDEPLDEPLAELLDPEPAPAEPTMARAKARVIRIRRAPAAPAEPAETLPGSLSPEAEADLQRELAALEAEMSGLAAPVDEPPAAIVAPAADPVLEAIAEAITDPQPAEAPRRARPVRRLRPGPIEPGLTDQSPAVAEAPPAADPAPTSEPAPHRPLADDQEAAMARLLAETNTQMDGPESRRRLSAIAHLKAAVAATVADRRAGRSAGRDEAERIDPYREDLSRIVRQPAAAAPLPPVQARPAPLVLVSEQRVDRSTVAPAPGPQPDPAAQPAGPVRPRRIAGLAAVARQDPAFDDEDDEDDDADLAPAAGQTAAAGGFAEFAAALDAQTLPELLEAAAAYAAAVEGRPHVSRPQLMRQVQAVLGNTPAVREDSLRGFGTLLREGRITKVRRGQYAISEGSHLLAKARRLAD